MLRFLVLLKRYQGLRGYKSVYLRVGAFSDLLVLDYFIGFKALGYFFHLDNCVRCSIYLIILLLSLYLRSNCRLAERFHDFSTYLISVKLCLILVVKADLRLFKMPLRRFVCPRENEVIIRLLAE